MYYKDKLNEAYQSVIKEMDTSLVDSVIDEIDDTEALEVIEVSGLQDDGSVSIEISVEGKEDFPHSITVMPNGKLKLYAITSDMEPAHWSDHDNINSILQQISLLDYDFSDEPETLH